MIFTDELELNRLYKRQFFLPIDEKNKKKGSAVFLLSPNPTSSLNILANPIMNRRYYESYFIEKDITYYINNEGFITEVNGKEYIHELVSSTLDKEYTAKNKLSLSKFKRINIDDNNIKKYESDCKSLSHVRTGDDYKGYLYIDNDDNVAGYVSSNNSNHSIQALEVCPEYRSCGLSKQILSQSIKNLGDNNLSVSKDNQVAIKLYKDYGFEVYNKDDHMYYMKLKGTSVNESAFIGRDFSDDKCQIDESFIRCNIDEQNIVFGFNSGIETINEATGYKSQLHRILYNERFKTPKEVLNIYDDVHTKFPDILNYHLTYDKYKSLNLFVDLGFYNDTFFRNNIYKMDRGVDLYFEFLNRFLNDIRLAPLYTKKTVIIPINEWINLKDEKVNEFNMKDSINPISIILRLVKKDPVLLKDWMGIDFILLSDNGYMRIDPANMQPVDITRTQNFITRLLKNEPILDNENEDSKKAIVANIADTLEKSQKIKLHNLTGDSGEISKDELVAKIDKAATVSNNTDEAIDNMEGDEYLKNLIDNISADDDGVQINATRKARLSKVQQDFNNKKIKNTTVRDIINKSHTDVELPETKLNIDTIDDSWQHLTFNNFEKVYDPNDDIITALNSFADKKNPIVIRDLNIEDTSTSEDHIQTYNVQMEDAQGQRFTLKFDVPKMKDSRFMYLRGNEKTINGQLVLLPISKTDEDTVQIVSNYNKIFIKRYGTSSGKSYEVADRLIKALGKYEGKSIKLVKGDNTRISSKYELPIDYIDIGNSYTRIETNKYTIYFNQDEIRDTYKAKINLNMGIPMAVDKSGNIMYFNENSFQTASSFINFLITSSAGDYKEVFENTKASNKHTYSKASILNTEIPLIVVAAYNEGLTKTLNKAGIEYHIEEKRPSGKDITYIKFNDGYIVYNNNYEASLLLNGLKDCDTENYSILEMDKTPMYLDFLDNFGGRIKADGLDNFYECMLDNITVDVLERYKLPTDYVTLLMYANELLADNKYIKHVDMSSNRYRTNELIAGYAYKALAEAYGDYKLNLKRGRKVPMSMKKTAIIDSILLDPTCADASKINDILDAENMNSVGFKGLSGMNSDRSYGLEKRTYDDSMINLLGMSTGFAGNVGLTRQTTIDMNIEGKRGYLKIVKPEDKLSATKSLCVTEALTPFGTTRDDPFRTAMTFIQTAKHGMRIKKGVPQLVSNGADQALPYLSSNTFSFKAKANGKITEKTDEYMIVKYDNSATDFIDLRENIQKNSSSGFFVSIKLDTDLKVGNKVTANQILAYDKLSYSDMVGDTGNLAYNLGALVKIAILQTDEGYEDSTIISEYLSDAMSSEVVLKKEVVLPKNTNILSIVKKGQAIKEGEALLIFQNAFDEDDINTLLKNLAEDEESISDLGRIPVKSKVEGVVTDIKIYRTVEKEELSDSLRKVVNDIEKPVTEMKKIMKKNGVEYYNQVDPDYKLEATGKLKNAQDSVLIEFYLKYEDSMSIGDKLVYFSALKGVTKEIFPKGKEPYSEFRKDEKMDSLLSIGSVNGRMVTSVIINGALNKILIELDRKVKDIAGIPFKYLNED